MKRSREASGLEVGGEGGKEQRQGISLCGGGWVERWKGTVENMGWMLRWAPDEMKADKGVVLEAVELYPAALEWASSDLKADRIVVQTAVSGDGLCLRCCTYFCYSLEIGHERPHE